ncbi:hypothetical protein pb186bvf_019705 [Paramecium bursaria]
MEIDSIVSLQKLLLIQNLSCKFNPQDYQQFIIFHISYNLREFFPSILCRDRQITAKHILDIDFEKQSLEQMILRSQITRPEQSFKCLSLVDEMQFVEQFYVIIDKGTLDAIYPDAEQLQVIQNHVNEFIILQYF